MTRMNPILAKIINDNEELIVEKIWNIKRHGVTKLLTKAQRCFDLDFKVPLSEGEILLVNDLEAYLTENQPNQEKNDLYNGIRLQD